MGLTDVNLSGSKVLEARLTIPAWGASYHDVTLDREVSLTGAQTLNVADLSVACTVLSGGASFGRSHYRLVAGAGGWGKGLPSKSYANDLGVKLLQVLTDAASAVGETLDPTTINATQTIGPQFTRPAQIAGRLLEQYAPNAWYIGEDGKTRLGARASSALNSKATVESLDIARGTAVISSDSIAGILPGVVVSGTSTTGPWSLTAADVEITVSDGAVRAKVWGQQGAGASRMLAAFRAIVDQLDPNRLFRGVYEYRVVTQTANRLNLQPVQVSTGMPVLQIVPMRPGVPGSNMKPALGSRVLVGFVNADPGRPYVHSFEDPDGGGFTPLSISLAASTQITANAPSIALGATPVPLAKASPVTTALNAIETWADALNTALAVPGATIGTVSAAMSTRTSTLNAAIAAANTATPTTVVTGQ
jgi:hypothetical protein